MRELLYRINGDSARAVQLPISGGSLEVPCYFASISSLKTNLYPIEYLKLLVKIGAPHILISAYDIVHTSRKNASAMLRLLKRAIKGGSRIMLDSGNYESYWRKDRKWTSKGYERVLKSTPHHLAMIYDNYDLMRGITKNIAGIEKETERQRKLASGGVVVPIIHASPAKLIKVTKEIANRLRPLLLAIPERELGEGVIERVVTLVRIRRELNKLGTYIPIHLLGTGNPQSLLLFSVFGADTFDGLEWCQTTVDPNNATLLHFHQRELLGKKLDLGISDGLTYQAATLLHNLTFFESWMNTVRKSLIDDDVVPLLEKYFDGGFLDNLRKQVKKVL